MKKTLSVLLVLAFVFSIASPVFAAQPGNYKVKSSYARIYSEPDGLSDPVGECPKGRIIEITEIKQGFGYAFFASTGISGWVEMVNLEQIIPDERKSGITEIIVTPPVKTEYVHNDEVFNSDGMHVYAVYKDGEQKEVTGYEVFVPSLAVTGEKKVTVAYSPKESEETFYTSFVINVIKQPISSLNIITLPKKTDYIEGNLPDITGLYVSVEYFERETQYFSAEQILADKDFSFSIDLTSPMKKGNHTITLRYKYDSITADFNINARQKRITNLEIKEMPESLVTHSTLTLPNIKGLVLTASYDNGTTQDIPYYDCETECDPSSFILGGGNKVTVTYEGLSVELLYTLAPLEITGIYLKLPQVLLFRMGYDIDLSALSVYYCFSDGSLEEAENYTVSPVNKYLSGSQDIAVECGEYSDVFSIYITPYYQKGDVDNTGTVKAEDARIALRCAVGFVKLGGYALTAADMNCDGVVKADDARLILRYAVGLEDYIGQSQVIM